MKRTKKLCSLLLAVIMVLGIMQVAALADHSGSIVMSFEKYDTETGTVTLLYGPKVVAFDAGDTGLTLAQAVLGEENINAPGGFVTDITIDGKKYSGSDMGECGSWSLYKNNAPDSVGMSGYVPTDGDVYRVILTTYDPKTYNFPTMTNDMDALYWMIADTTGDTSKATALVQSSKPAQSAIDSMVETLGAALVKGTYHVLIDGRSVQVDTSSYPYVYTSTLSVDKTSPAAGETVTVKVTSPIFKVVADGYPKANGKTLTAGKNEGEYTFTMPKSDVVITVEFAQSDVQEGTWYYDGMLYAVKNGILNGVGNGKYAPTAKLSRAMMATMLYRLEGSPEVTAKNKFSDVKEDAWYGKAVIWAAENGIVTGTDKGTFEPNADITREQLATMLYRYAQYKKMDVSVGEDTNILSYNDAFEISEYAVSAIQWACGAEVMNGTDELVLSPKGTATRAQAASMLARIK